MSETVEFFGEEFRIGERVGLMPMMRYSRAIKRSKERERSGADADGMDEVEIFDATLSLLEQCVHPDEWDRFERHTTEKGAGLDDYMEFAGHVMAALSGRPTGPRSDSSTGPRTIEPSSTAVSSSPATPSMAVIGRLNDQGRPDLALVVRKRAEALGESLSA